MVSESCRWKPRIVGAMGAHCARSGSTSCASRRNSMRASSTGSRRENETISSAAERRCRPASSATNCGLAMVKPMRSVDGGLRRPRPTLLITARPPSLYVACCLLQVTRDVKHQCIYLADRRRQQVHRCRAHSAKTPTRDVVQFTGATRAEPPVSNGSLCLALILTFLTSGA